MTRLVLPFVAVLALVASGCGGGSKSSETTTTTETVTQESTTTTETAGTTTEAAGTTTGTADLSKILGNKDCQALLAAGASFAQAMAGANGASSDEAAKALQDMASKVPDAIKSDVDTLAQWYTNYAAKLKAIGIKPGQPPTASQIQQLQAAITSSSTADVQKASQHLDAWAKKNCTG